MQHESLVFDGWASEATVAEGSTVVENVLLCGNLSKNGYRIPPSAFGSESRVRQLYEGRPVFLDHGEPGRGRSVRDLAGYIESVSLRAGKPYGSIRTLEDGNGRKILTLAKQKLRDVGMSHTARYRFAESEEEVESVEEVLSVDVVAFPATTKSFHEHKEPKVADEATKLLEKQLDSVQGERDELKAKLAETEGKLKEGIEAYKKLKAEADELRDANESLEAELDEHKARIALEQRKADVREELESAGLDLSDEHICSERFLKLLYAEKDESVRKDLIEDRKALLESTTSNDGPVSRERRKSDPAPKAVDVDEYLSSPDLFK